MQSGELVQRPVQKETGAAGGRVVHGGSSRREPLRDLNGRSAVELATPTKGCFFGLLASPASSCKAGGVALKPPRPATPTSHWGAGARSSLGTQKVDDKPQGAEIHGKVDLSGGGGCVGHLGRRKTKFPTVSTAREGDGSEVYCHLALGVSQRLDTTDKPSAAPRVFFSSPLTTGGAASSSVGPASSCGSTSGLWCSASPSEEDASTGWWNGRGSLAVEQSTPRSLSGHCSPAVDGTSSPFSIIRRKAAASFKLRLIPTRNRDFWRYCGGSAPAEDSPLTPQRWFDHREQFTRNDSRRNSLLPPLRFASPTTNTSPVFGLRKSPSGRSDATDQQQKDCCDTTPYSAGMGISWREGLVGRVLEMDGMSCFHCCCLRRESHPDRGVAGTGYGALGRHLFERHGARKRVYEVFGPTKWLCPCSDSITDGNGVIFSSRSDWSIFCRNDLFEL